MAAFNSTAADVMRNASFAADHFERAAAATFIVPTTNATLQLEPFTGVGNNQHFVTAAAAAAAASSVGGATSHHHTHQTNATSSSYTFVQIKREPCQVSEVTTSNNCRHHQQLTTTQQQQQHSSSMSSSSKTTLTTLVKIEASSPKVHDLDKGSLNAPLIPSTNNSVPIGIAVARKRPQESATSVGNATIPVQQSLNKEVNCFGIRVADIGGVSSGCGNFYFTGNSDLMTGAASAEELALTTTGVQSVNRAPSTFWQYPSALPIESVISMSPAAVGLQYQRDTSRGQVVLLPATAAALGISNIPLYTPTDPFQQAAAAAFVWPSYIPQGTATAALQPPPNFIFPSMSPHSSLQASSYATPLQLFGSNYLTAAAAAAAAAAATSTFCQHSQQHNQQQTNSSSNSSSSTSTLSLGLGSTGCGSGGNSSITSGTTSRFLSVAATESKRLQETSLSKHHQHFPLVLPPATMKIEEWNATEYMATAAGKTTTTTLSATTHQNHHIGSSATALAFERDKTTANLMELQASNAQALNLMRLPTPPTPASLEATASQIQPQILFQASTSSPALLNLSASNAAILPRVGSAVPSNMTTNFLNSVGTTTTLAAAIGAPPTPLGDEALNFKTTSIDAQQFVVGVPRMGSNVTNDPFIEPPPQMQDVNIQTDTPVCSEDESSSCPHAIQNSIPTSASVASTTPPPSEMDAHETESEQPLELTTAGGGVVSVRTTDEENLQETDAAVSCHKNDIHNTFENPGEAGNTTVAESTTVNVSATNLGAVPPIGAPNTTELMTVVPQPVTVQATAEDLTGLELLSNISTSSLAKNTSLNVKLEPVEHSEYMEYSEVEEYNNTANTDKAMRPNSQNTPAENNIRLLTQPPLAEPLGGLNLLCALAEQRIQEEVQSSGSIFSTNTNVQDDQMVFHQQQPPPQSSVSQLAVLSGLEHKNGTQVSGGTPDLAPPIMNEAKRKKHKHSKSSKSSKKSQHSSKKNKKKCAKEKRKNKQTAPPESLERVLDFEDDEDLQEDFKSAFDKVDSNYKRFGKWPDREEIFKAMESDMRMRLAEITRQYRKKKRKLDEISKSKKHKKKALKDSILSGSLSGITIGSTCSSMSCLSNMNMRTNPSATSSTTISTSSLCDYKFSKLLTKPGNTTTGSYLSPSNFLRFSDSKPQIQPQFPPATDANINESLLNTPLCSTSTLYKSLRLEPSSLVPPDGDRGTSNRSQKHSSLEMPETLITTSRKSRKLSTARLSSDSEAVSSQKPSQRSGTESNIDRELVLTSEHLYRKETRVLTDMGGLFYAGVMKPLQPPDVYAITLDGERGNKSHIMSREEIFKDTILEVSPSNIEKVPVGTRLCAYWSQQYRCLYPGRAIESESSDDGMKNDFVSVEFDDGDSGRIRLQNIRFLLSDYPIVEYDNPLYSLGKQKRSLSKSGNNSENTQHQETSSIADEENQGNELEEKSDVFAHRKEKKRIKNLKKKSLTNSSVSGSCSGRNVSTDSNERLHKHHKHKKRKKHKKHHHRKALTAETETNSTYIVCAATVYSNGRREEQLLGQDEEEANDGQPKCKNDNTSLNKNEMISKDNNKFKTELVSRMEAEAESVAYKVKAENFDIEEETTSNMMSEASDEAKMDDDEIEHNNSKGSKIAAFLPERQLWGWLGKTYRKAGVKGRARKQFYKTIKRGKETITVGDCAVFLSTGRPDRPYIGRIESMWETASSNKVVRVRWFYHPEETIGCPNLKYPGALFESPHEDENDVQTISHRCAVLPFMSYFEKFGADSKQYQSIYDNNDTYYLSGYYNPRLQILKLQDDIPIIE